MAAAEIAALGVKALPSAGLRAALRRAVESMWISLARSRPVRAEERVSELPGHGSCRAALASGARQQEGLLGSRAHLKPAEVISKAFAATAVRM